MEGALTRQRDAVGGGMGVLPLVKIREGQSLTESKSDRVD